MIEAGKIQNFIGVLCIGIISNGNPIVVPQSANYTLQGSNRGNIIEVTGTINITLPDLTPADIDMEVLITNIGGGTITFVPDAGVTLLSPGGADKLTIQYANVVARYRGTNEWIIRGSLDI